MNNENLKIRLEAEKKFYELRIKEIEHELECIQRKQPSCRYCGKSDTEHDKDYRCQL